MWGFKVYPPFPFRPCSLLALIERAESGQQSLRVALFSAGGLKSRPHSRGRAPSCLSQLSPPCFPVIAGTLAKLARCGRALRAADAAARVRALRLGDSGDRTEAQYARRLLAKLGSG